MRIFIAIHKLDAYKDIVRIKNIEDNPIDSSPESLRQQVVAKYKSINGWYCVEIDSSKIRILKDSDINDTSIKVKTPFKIKMSDKVISPFYAMDREWTRIPNFSGYLASEFGEILTLKTSNFTKGVTAGHYLKVSIFRDGSRKTKMEYVHNLVAITYHGPNPNGRMVVMHGDEDKFNNAKDNLKWGSQSDNIKDSWKYRRSLEDVFNDNINEGNESMENYNVVATMELRLEEASNLTEYSDMISTEGGMITKISGFFVKRLSSISGFFKTASDKAIMYLEGFRSNGAMAKEVKSTKKLLSYAIKHVNYIDVEKRPAPVTIGYKTDLLTGSALTIELLNKTNSVIIESLDNVSVMVSKVLSDADYRKSFKPSSKEFSAVEDVTVDLINIMHSLVDSNANNDRMVVEKIIPNIASLGKISNDLKEIEHLLDVKRIENVSKMVETLYEKINILTELIESKNGDFAISKEAIKALSHGLDVNARLVTIAMSAYTMGHQHLSMVNSLGRILEKAL